MESTLDRADSERVWLEASLSSRVREFVDGNIIPNERRLYAGKSDPSPRDLVSLAQQSGLWGSFLPREYGGWATTLMDYLPIAEEEGRSEFGPAVFGSDTALDVRFLCAYSNETVKDLVVPQLMEGGSVAFAATEPEIPGSMPGRIRTTAQWSGDHWTLSGRKWFISRASEALFYMVLARVEGGNINDSDTAVFLVPFDAVGVRRLGRQTLLGRNYGQRELEFDQVSLPGYSRLGEPGQTAELLGQRLLVGRTVRAMQWVGLARRCLELLCARLTGERAHISGLVDKQLLRAGLFEAYQSVTSARLMVLEAGRHLAEGKRTAIAVNTAKVAATRALSQAADTAIQVWGAEGLLDEHSLSGIYRYARATHMMDGPDEALISSVGRQLLQGYRESDRV